MRSDGADQRQEPAALVFMAGLFAVLSTPHFATLLDEPEVDGASVAVFAFLGGGIIRVRRLLPARARR